MKQFYVYLHCRPDGSPFYVGKGHGKRSHNFTHRRNPHHRNIIAKHGKGNICVLVFPRGSEQDAFDDEINWISALRNAGFELCNQTDGGEGSSGCFPSTDTRAKIGKASKSRGVAKPILDALHASNIGNQYALGYKHTEETRLQMSMSHKGKPVWNKGKKYSLTKYSYLNYK